MVPEALHTHILLAVLLTTLTLAAIPVLAMAMSKAPDASLTRDRGPSEGAACDLPPAVELDGRSGTGPGEGPPPLDLKVPEKYETATFAMG